MGTRQLTRTHLEVIAPLVLGIALGAEYDDNWRDSYTEVSNYVVPRDSNVTSSTVVFKLKSIDEESLRMKARLVLHGN